MLMLRPKNDKRVDQTFHQMQFWAGEVLAQYMRLCFKINAIFSNDDISPWIQLHLFYDKWASEESEIKHGMTLYMMFLNTKS